jgi:hypothetical protein
LSRRDLAKLLWDEQGRRLLPSDRALSAAMATTSARDVWKVCEDSDPGPVYLLPTREWIAALARFCDRMKVRTVLEVAAGDGFLSACLQRARPRLTVHATDDYSWRRPAARGGRVGISPGAHVERSSAARAVAKYEPDLTIVCWAPPGRLVERVIRAPSSLVLDISVDGDVCGDDARTWRYEKEFLEGAIERRAWCRLDHGTVRRTRVTLYFGARHPRHSSHAG